MKETILAPFNKPAEKSTRAERKMIEENQHFIEEAIELFEWETAQSLIDECKKRKININLGGKNIADVCNKKINDIAESVDRHEQIIPVSGRVAQIINFCVANGIKVNDKSGKTVNLFDRALQIRAERLQVELVMPEEYVNNEKPWEEVALRNQVLDPRIDKGEVKPREISSWRDGMKDLNVLRDDVSMCDKAGLPLEKEKLGQRLQSLFDTDKAIHGKIYFDVKAAIVEFCEKYDITMDLKEYNQEFNNMLDSVIEHDAYAIFEYPRGEFMGLSLGHWIESHDTLRLKKKCQQKFNFLVREVDWKALEDLKYFCRLLKIKIDESEEEKKDFYIGEKAMRLIANIPAPQTIEEENVFINEIADKNPNGKGVYADVSEKIVKLCEFVKENQESLASRESELEESARKKICALLDGGSLKMNQQSMIALFDSAPAIRDDGEDVFLWGNLVNDEALSESCLKNLKTILESPTDNASLSKIDAIRETVEQFSLPLKTKKISQECILKFVENRLIIDGMGFEFFRTFANLKLVIDFKKVSLNTLKISRAMAQAIKSNTISHVENYLDLCSEYNIDLDKVKEDITPKLKSILHDNIDFKRQKKLSGFDHGQPIDFYSKLSANKITENILDQADLEWLAADTKKALITQNDSRVDLLAGLQFFEEQDVHTESDALTRFAYNQIFFNVRNLAPGKTWKKARLALDVPIEKTFEEAIEIFGEFLTYDIYEQFKELDAGKLSPEFEDLGVRHTKARGKEELKQSILDFRHGLLTDDIDPQLADSNIKRSLFKKMISFDSYTHGAHSDWAFNSLIKNSFNFQGEVRPLGEDYIPSEVLAITKSKKQEDFIFSKAFLTRYGQLLDSMVVARKLFFEKKEDGLQDIMDVMNKKIETVKAELAQKMAMSDRDIIKEAENRGQDIVPEFLVKRRENLQKRIELLDQAKADDSAGPQQIFNILRQFKGDFDEELRQLMFFFGYYYNQDHLFNMIMDDCDKNNPQVQELSYVLDFVDHIVNQETLKQYFTDKTAAKEFAGLLNISVLEQEMARLVGGRGEGKINMQFVPTRNILTEASGHIANACWGSRYESILKMFPNFISLIMVQNPDTRDEKFCGAAFLIETKSENGEDLLVIRGLNPQENTINQLSPEDFVNKLKEYLQPIVEKMGRQLAIVIDYHGGHAGGSCTNRPVLFQYLLQMKKSLKPVKLASAEDTTFNEYNIVNNCYLL